MMRFYFEDHVGGNVATKCLRVCSNSSTHEVVETLSEKFRPDMKMLTTCYSLYEIHASKGKHSCQVTEVKYYTVRLSLSYFVPLWCDLQSIYFHTTNIN